MTETRWKLVSKKLLTENLGVFRFRPVTEVGVPDFKCGQFVNIGLEIDGKNTFRAYSIASSPFEKNYYDFYIKHKVHPTLGKITSALFSMGVGDLVSVQKPKGAFTLDGQNKDNHNNSRQMIFVASGTGLAPFISYLHYMKESKMKNNVVLVHGVSYVPELGYREMLEAFSSEHSLNLTYVPTISRPDDESSKNWNGHVGRVESVFDGIERNESYLETALKCNISPQTTFFYLCGYSSMINNIMKIIKRIGFVNYQNKRKDGTFDMKCELYGI